MNCIKSQTIKLIGKKQVDYATSVMNETLAEDDLWCVEIKKHKEAKTLQQLRGLFGTWYDYLSDTLGETKDDLHDIHKTGYRYLRGSDGQIIQFYEAGYGGWLAEIYQAEPFGDIQEMWVDLTTGHGTPTIQDTAKISLKWATIDQMREYMKRIEHYYISAGYPLPILEKYRRWYQ